MFGGTASQATNVRTTTLVAPGAPSWSDTPSLPGAPGGSSPGLKSFDSSEASFTSEERTAFFLSCFAPTLFVGIVSA